MTLDEITSAAVSGVSEFDLLTNAVADCNMSDDESLEITVKADQSSGEPCIFTLKFQVDALPPAAELQMQFRQMAHDFLYGVG